MANLKVSLLADELRGRGYDIGGYSVLGRFHQRFLDIPHIPDDYCIGPIDNDDEHGEPIADTTELWITRRDNIINSYSLQDRSLPDTTEVFVLANSAEAWMIRDSSYWIEHPSLGF